MHIGLMIAMLVGIIFASCVCEEDRKGALIVFIFLVFLPVMAVTLGLSQY